MFLKKIPNHRTFLLFFTFGLGVTIMLKGLVVRPLTHGSGFCGTVSAVRSGGENNPLPSGSTQVLRYLGHRGGGGGGGVAVYEELSYTSVLVL